MGSTERTTRLATAVEDLTAAWAFIMAHIDEVGPKPRVSISPCMDPGGEGQWFDVAVEGMIEEPA